MWHRLLIKPLLDGAANCCKSLCILYIVYGILPFGGWIRQAINSITFHEDEQHLQFTFFTGFFGFWPIVIVLGSRLLAVSMTWQFLYENTLHLIAINQLRISDNLADKEITAKHEFESQMARGELLNLLYTKKSYKSKLFEVSGTPKRP